MKAIVNSESLFLLAKLVKNGSYEIIVKLLAESEKGYQVEIITPNSNKEDGTLAIPKEAFALLPRKTSLIIENGVIKSKDQEINLENEEGKQIQEIRMNKGRCIDIINFSELIEVTYATTKDNPRKVLKCICIDKCNFVALDGYRMSIRSNIEDITDKPMIIPGHIVEVLKNFTKSDIATIYEDDKYMKICFGWISITSKKEKDDNGEDLKFINYQSILPKDHTTEVIVNASEIVEICKQIVKLNQSSNNLTNIKFNTEGSYLAVRSQGIKFKRYFSAEVKGDELNIAINAKYLLETLKNYTGNVTMYMSTPVATILITDGKNKKDLVLPIRLMR